MSTENQDPEDVFWSLIESDPTNPTHRLIFADWCDENDQPTMGDVQRWLAATRRFPQQHDQSYCWFDDMPSWSESRSSLPGKLFTNLPEIRKWVGQIHFSCSRYSSIREAEESLAQSWEIVKTKYPSWMEKNLDFVGVSGRVSPHQFRDSLFDPIVIEHALRDFAIVFGVLGMLFVFSKAFLR
jgi:uncharacterized protein (TIGR02996 family)